MFGRGLLTIRVCLVKPGDKWTDPKFVVDGVISEYRAAQVPSVDQCVHYPASGKFFRIVSVVWVLVGGEIDCVRVFAVEAA